MPLGYLGELDSKFSKFSTFEKYRENTKTCIEWMHMHHIYAITHRKWISHAVFHDIFPEFQNLWKIDPA